MDIATAWNLLASAFDLAPTLASVVGFAAVLARFLPPPAVPASGVYPIVYAVVNAVAMNGGQARNANAPRPPA